MIHVFDWERGWGWGWDGVGVGIDTFRYKPKLERIYRALKIGKQSGCTMI